ncbi:DUF2142 domain-containing protein [Microbacterium atlanticum]|uniref:DUF2142 domain-containing protein n=1 Tax=Microbacterium atlanticum TaxID=2782168 RepID=UPI0018894B83|nr:DUF2142 domain-containing protein [Microbacterium atlanticum]
MTTESDARLRRVASIAVPLLFLLTLLSWVFASPIGSSPDDDFHLPSIWCGIGDRDALCEPTDDPDTRMVPGPVVNAPCYAFRSDQSADCWNPVTVDMVEAAWMNARGLYPPVFYGVMSLFVGPDVTTSVLAMRVFNSALTVGLLTATFFALPRSTRPALVVSVVATSVPLGLFVFASTNPSSWALLSAAVVWVSLYGALRTTGRRQIVLAGLAVLATLLGAGARADAGVFAVFGVLLAAVLGLRRGRPPVVPAIAAALIVVTAAAFYFTSGQGGVLASGLPNENPPLSGSQHLSNLLELPQLFTGAFGAVGLGWLDTQLPASVHVLAFGVFCAAVFIGIHRVRPRRAVALALAAAALWAVPLVLLAQSRSIVGTTVQSRYVLPLMIILVGVATLAPRIVQAWRGPRSFVAALALAFAMSLALHDNIRRYTVGQDSNALDPGAGAEWWWSAAPSPLVVWLGGSAAFAAALGLLWLVVARLDDDQPTSERTSRDDELVHTSL